MSSGNHRTAALVVLALVMVLAAAAVAQTSDQTCQNDSLLLYSPAAETISVSLQEAGRFGNAIRWADLDDAISTCAALLDTADLGFVMEISGDYADDIDRELRFSASGTGAIGANDVNRLLLRWTNAYISISGTLVGEINLSNSGGLWRHDSGVSGFWIQMNENLPRYLAYTNVIALAQALAPVDETMLCALTSGVDIRNGPRGLYRSEQGGPWDRIAADVFTDSRLITQLAYSPNSNDRFAVGTGRDGLYLTTDGGQSFTQWSRQLDPDAATYPSAFNVTALAWEGGRLFVAVEAFGLFRSEDEGQSFTRLDSLLVPDYPGQGVIDPDPDDNDPDPEPLNLSFPRVNRLVVDPADPNLVLACLDNHALYRSTDGGLTWRDMYGDWLVYDPDAPAAWRHSALSVYFDTGGAGSDDDIYVVGTRQQGLWRSGNSGENWERVAAELLPDSVTVSAPVTGLIADPGQSGNVIAIAASYALLHGADNGADWSLAPEQPYNLLATDLRAYRDGSDRYLYPTRGGGIFVPGTQVRLSDTILPGSTDPELRNLDLGLYMTVGAGVFNDGDSFSLICQDFQGWLVWRSTSDDVDDMELLGKYDKTNPETCIEGYCGDENWTIAPNCFSERRAACFDLTDPDSVTFFDGDVYNGFVYNYAVSTFDYGNTAGIEPIAFDKPMLFSPRFPDDPYSPFEGDGNRVRYQVNTTAREAATGEQVFVFPNPLRRELGFPGSEGEQVVFSNLPPESRIQVFTAAGDEVADLGPELQQGSNIYWQTRNQSGESLASGVYIYRVEMPERETYFGKLVIIR